MDAAGLKRAVEQEGIPYPGICRYKVRTSAGKSCTTIPLEGPERMWTILQILAESAEGPMVQ